MTKKSILILSSVLFISLAATGCEQKAPPVGESSPPPVIEKKELERLKQELPPQTQPHQGVGEKFGKELDQKLDKALEKVDEGMKKTGDTLDKGLDKAGNKINNFLDKAGDKIKEKTDSN